MNCVFEAVQALINQQRIKLLISKEVLKMMREYKIADGKEHLLNKNIKIDIYNQDMSQCDRILKEWTEIVNTSIMNTSSKDEEKEKMAVIE